MNKDEFVLNTSDAGKITSLGFNVNSLLLEKNLSGGNGKYDILNHLSVPAGLVNIAKKQRGGNPLSKIVNDAKIISRDIYDNLLKLVDPGNESKGGKKTKKIIPLKKNKTKRII